MTVYLIDGYNWLFRHPNARTEEDLRGMRDDIIRELSLKLSIAKIDATLIFDSQFQKGPAEHLTAKGISICYTEEGQTADEYILEFIKYASKPQNYTVVTSDNRLAWAVRQKNGHSLHIHEFKKMLERIFLKKSRGPVPETQEKPHSTPLIKKRPSLNTQYEKIFEERLEQELKVPQGKKSDLSKQRKKAADCQLISDHERWRRIFEGEGDGA